MTGKCIDFLSVDAAGFNQRRDQWRSAASSSTLSKAGLRVATVLPTYINREYGYAFPTNQDLARDIDCDQKTVKRGLADLENNELIERKTKLKRNDRGEVSGKVRRIYLTTPQVIAPPFHPKGQSPKDQAEARGRKRATEGPPVCPYIPDRTTLDKKIRREKKGISAVPVRKDVPSAYRNDTAFLDTFDETVMAMTDGQQIGAGEMERIVQQAFDQTTNSNDLFMPFHWNSLCDQRFNDPTAAGWFRQRTGQLIHRRAT